MEDFEISLNSQTNSESESQTTNSLSSQSPTDLDYIPSQTPESEDYTSYTSSELNTPTESEYSTDSEYSQSSN